MFPFSVINITIVSFFFNSAIAFLSVVVILSFRGFARFNIFVTSVLISTFCISFSLYIDPVTISVVGTYYRPLANFKPFYNAELSHKYESNSVKNDFTIVNQLCLAPNYKRIIPILRKRLKSRGLKL